MAEPKKVFEEKIKPVLTYVGAIGATLTSIAYIVLMFVLIKGFKYQQTATTITFAVINAMVGLVIANFLKYQGLSFAKNLEQNKSVVEEYYSTKTKDKKNHDLKYFWLTTLIKDIAIKGVTVVATSCGLIYIVIVGSNDWALLGLAVVNLVLFICFGLLSLNKAYEYYNNVYINYMKDKIKENKEQCSKSTENNTETSKNKSDILPKPFTQENLSTNSE